VNRVLGARSSRRRLLGSALGLATTIGAARLGGGRLAAATEHSPFRFARLVLPGLPNPRPNALRRLAWELVRRTSIATESDPVEVRPSDPALFRHPFLFLAGDRGFASPPEADLVRLRRYLTYGGFLLIDSAEGRAGGTFDESVRRLLASVLPGELPARIADENVLWKSFYVLSGAPGRILAAPYVEGVERDRRLAVIYSQNDLALFFGLGKANTVDRMEVRWPSGAVEKWEHVAANRKIVLTEGKPGVAEFR